MVIALLSLGNNVFVDSLYEPALEPTIRTLSGNVSAPGIFCDPCPTGGLLRLI